MHHTHAIRAQLRNLSCCALTGLLAGLLATPAYALNPTALATHNGGDSAALATTAEAPDALPMIATANTTDTDTLPEAPEATDSASLIAPSRTDLLASAEGSGSSTTSNATTPKKHHVRAGFLALGIVGGAAAGLGAYIFSIKTSATGERDALGTMFLAPGAAAAGLGFYFAFK